MNHQQQRDERLERLDAFVGEWRLETPAFPLPAEVADAARATFEWTLDDTFMLERLTVPVAGAPDGLCQRWLGTFSDDGNAIEGRWETSHDGRDWQLDFELFYHRVER